MAAASRRGSGPQWKPKDDGGGGKKQEQNRSDKQADGNHRHHPGGYKFVARNKETAEDQTQPQKPFSSGLRAAPEKDNAGDGTAKLVFVPYLPQDEDGGDASDAQEVVDLSNSMLSSLLKMKAQDFWAEVASNTSLRKFLDSYLHFRRRWYDIPASTADARVLVGDEQLSRRVFMVFFRMSSNQDPGAATSVLPAPEHAALLLEKGLFTVPRLLDICALYEHDNAELTSKVVSNVFNAQPAYEREIANAVPAMLSTIRTICDRCYSKIDQEKTTTANSRIKVELLEVLRFIYDSVATFSAFVNVYAPAASLLLTAASTRTEDNLLTTISSIHDSLLPALRRKGDAVGAAVELDAYVKRLNPLLADLSWRLLTKGYLEVQMDPKVKGQLLTQALMALSGGDVTGTTSILQLVVKEYDLTESVQRLLETGFILVDDDQYALLLTFLPDTRPAIEASVVTDDAVASTDQDAAIFQSQIAQVKDLFPDYGDGFLSACLEVYDHNPERVIQHILEGTLHPELASLDATLQHRPKTTKEATTTARKDKGKGKLVDQEQKPVSTSSSSSSSSNGENRRAVQGRFVRRSQNPDDDVTKLLNVRDAKTSRLALLYGDQYEDEYDDSFDDLDMNVGEAGLEADSLVDLVARKKAPEAAQASTGGSLPTPTPRKAPTGPPKSSKPLFLKDGKLYNYRVAGAVQVSSAEEAEAMKKHEEGLIHGLGKGGNVPQLGADDSTQEDEEEDEEEGRGQQQQQQQQFSGRGRGRGRGLRKFRRDGALKKHMAGLRGF